MVSKDADAAAVAAFHDRVYSENEREWKDLLSGLLAAYLDLHKSFKGLPEREPIVIAVRKRLRGDY